MKCRLAGVNKLRLRQQPDRLPRYNGTGAPLAPALLLLLRLTVAAVVLHVRLRHASCVREKPRH